MEIQWKNGCQKREQKLFVTEIVVKVSRAENESI